MNLRFTTVNENVIESSEHCDKFYMDLRLFEIFCRVYEENSFSRAAEKLFLTQPTISEHIKTLEEYFEAKLFDRTGREINPTHAGRLLYEYGKHITQAKKATVEGMQDYLNRLKGKLLIGGSTIPGEYILPHIIGGFLKQYPGVEATLRIGDTKSIITDVRQGNVEIGFVGSSVADRTLEFQKFATDELVLVAPTTKEWKKCSVLTLKELTTIPLIARETGSGTQKTVEQHFEKLDYDIRNFKISAIIGSTTGVKEAILSGVGLSILSARAVRREIKSGMLKTIAIREINNFSRSFFMVLEKRKYHSPICKAFSKAAMNFSAEEGEEANARI